MYYNIKSQEIISNYPNTLLLDNGTIITGDTFSTNLLAEAGFYTIRNDFPAQPANTTEDINSRVVVLDKPYVDINRTWILAVPPNISARQIRLWLLNNNIPLSNVDSAIDTISDNLLKEKTKVEWEYAPYIERNHPLIDSLGNYLGLNSSQIDQAFIEANTL